MTHDEILEFLCAMPAVEFEATLTRLSVPPQLLPGAHAPQVERAVHVLRYLESQGRVAEVAALARPGGGRIAPNNLPPRRLFVGREEELRALEEALGGTRAGVTRSMSLYGLGGVGKTALALEYAHRAAERGTFPGGVWWVPEFRPLEAFVRLAGTLAMIGPPGVRNLVAAALAAESAAAKLVQAVQLALQNHPEPSLLVLDDVDAEGWTTEIPGGAVRVLVTTRDERMALGARVQLGVLAPEQARELATALAGPAEAQEAEARDRVILGQLGALAVAVEVAARAVDQWARSWRAYAEHLSAEMEPVLDDPDVRSRDYPHRVFAVLDLAIDRCSRDLAARRLLEGFAAFAPEGVPWAWAESAAGLPSGSRSAAKARATLRQCGLVTLDEAASTASMHRLIHWRVRRRTGTRAWAETGRRAAAAVARWLSDNVSPARMADVDARRAHVDEALLIAEQLCDDTVWMTIASPLATYLQQRAQYTAALPLMKQALAVSERLDPPDPALIARNLSNLGLLLRDLRRLEEALPPLERSLTIAEAVYGSAHAKVATRLSNLATVLKDLGRLAEAEERLRRALLILEEAHGREHPGVVPVLSNLAPVLQDLRRVDEALPLLSRAIAIGEKAYGTGDHRMAPLLSNMAALLQEKGRLDEAREHVSRALAITESVYGPEHPKLTPILQRLSAVAAAQGDAEAVPQYLLRALAIEQKARGVLAAAAHVGGAAAPSAQLERTLRIDPSPPRIFAATMLLCDPPLHQDAACIASPPLSVKAVLAAARALPALRNALERWETSAGSESAQVVVLLTKLGLALKDLGRPAEALPLLGRALATVVETVGGAPHPALVTCLSNLAVVMKDLNLPAEAKPLWENVLRCRDDLEDRRSAAPSFHLALALKHLGWRNEAQVLLLRVRRIVRRDREERDHEALFTDADEAMIEDALRALVEDDAAARSFAEDPPARLHRAAPDLWFRDARTMVGDAVALDKHPAALVDVLLALDGPEAAVGMLRRIVDVTLGAYGSEERPWNLFEAGLAALGRLDRATDAQALAQHILAAEEKRNGPESARVATTLVNLGVNLRELGLTEVALAMFERSLRIVEAIHGPEHEKVATRLAHVGSTLCELGRVAEARPVHERGLRICEKVFGPRHPETGFALFRLASTLGELGEHAEALPLLRRALVIDEETRGPASVEITILFDLSVALTALARDEEAISFAERTLARHEKAVEEKQPSDGLSERTTTVVRAHVALARREVTAARSFLAIARKIGVSHRYLAHVAFLESVLDLMDRSAALQVANAPEPSAEKPPEPPGEKHAEPSAVEALEKPAAKAAPPPKKAPKKKKTAPPKRKRPKPARRKPRRK
jgi:tetratricopeptide (TPR) repeat protein